VVAGKQATFERQLAARDTEIQQLRATIAQLQSLIERLSKTNERLADKLTALTEEVTRLRAQLSRALGNSPETPSGQIPPYIKPPRRKTGRKPGRKPGHEGACRAPPKEPDREADHTLGQCPHCDGPVKPVRDAGFGHVVRIRYIEDILPGNPEVTKHNIHQYWCRGCKRRVEPAVTAALPGAHLGLRVVVWSAVQHFVHGVPTGKIVAMLLEDYGFVVTEGGIQAAWHQLAKFVYHAYEAILGRVRAAGVLHADETGWRINGQTGWLWCFATKQEVGYFIDRSRSATVATTILGEEFGGTLIQDFYAAYNACNAAETQFCLAHLLREFEKVRARDGGKESRSFAAFRTRVSRIIREAIKFHRKSTSPPAREAARDRFERRLRKIMEEPTRDKDVNRLVNRMWRSAHGIFTFLTTRNVDPTNNHAERQIRCAVVMRKISGGSRSDHGADTRAVLMSVFRTQQLQDLDPTKATIELVVQRIIELHRTKRPRSTSRG